MRLFDYLSPEWQKTLGAVEGQLAQISTQLGKAQLINPRPELIFSALGAAPSHFRVILVGQDPYPKAQHAMGLAFSVPPNSTELPPTLKNIQKEFAEDIGKSLNPDLTIWRERGVLLLNRILTCETGKSLSHENLGWQLVTEQVMKAVIVQNPNTVGILWGNYAAQVEKLFNPELIIKSAHPSPLSAHRGFFGSKPFTKANELLLRTGQKPINWA